MMNDNLSEYSLTTEVWEEIPALIDGVWTTVSYSSQDEFTDDLESNLFKEVGEYDFDEYFHRVLETRNYFLKNKEYCSYARSDRNFVKFWDFEKLKCRKGVFLQHGEKRWYVSRDLYFWWNFLPIFFKKEKRDKFPDITDAHMRMDLYELIAELKGLHAIGTKKRQFGSSYYHAAKLINRLWFEPFLILKIGASLDRYLGGKDGTWRYFNSYRNWLNQKTAWYRHLDGGDSGPWQQKRKQYNPHTNREEEKGRMGILTGMTFERSPTAGVGGATTYFFHEEAGVAPKMDETYGYMLSAVEDGDEATGQFIGFGSVGDLSQCGPLRKYMMAPFQNKFYGVPNNMADPTRVPIISGLFISEAHAYKGFIDQWGNSDVEGAIKHLEALKIKKASEMEPKDYALYCSQKPTWMSEAFKYRGEAEFPIQLLEAEDKHLAANRNYELVTLDYDPTDERGERILAKLTTKPPISEFPLSPRTEDKTGSIVVYERPIQNLTPLQTYYISIDPVGQGKTITSKSLVSCYVYRNAQMVTRTIDGVTETQMEGDKIVCSWCGRFDDINDTHEQLIKIILWYKAWALVEANIDLLITEMKNRNLQRYLVPRSQFQFGTELKNESSAFYDYGWKNVGNVFDKFLINYLFKFLTEVIYAEYDDEGNTKLQIKGVRRINDRMALAEMIAYYKGMNVDRIVTLAALACFIEVQRGHRRGNAPDVVITENEDLESMKIIPKLNNTPFHKLGNSSMNRSVGGKQFFNKRRR